MTHFGEETQVHFRDFDPNQATVVTVAGVSTNWIDMKNFHRLTVIAVRTVGTGVVKAASLRASAVAAGTSAAVVTSLAASTNGTGLLNAATAGWSGSSPGAGMIVLEATSDEIAAAVSDGRYVAAFMQLATQTDEFGMIYILSEPRYAESGLTKTRSAT